MSVAIPVLIRLLSLFGVSLSPFAAGAIVAGAIAIAFAGYSGWLVHRGYDWAETKCEAATLREHNQQLESRLAEKARQIAIINGIQQRDAKRAADAEATLRKNQEAIDATPQNPIKCFTRDMSRRVRDVR